MALTNVRGRPDEGIRPYSARSARFAPPRRARRPHPAVCVKPCLHASSGGFIFRVGGMQESGKQEQSPFPARFPHPFPADPFRGLSPTCGIVSWYLFLADRCTPRRRYPPAPDHWTASFPRSLMLRGNDVSLSKNLFFDKLSKFFEQFKE